MARKKPSERIYQMFNAANSQERIKWQSNSQKGYDFYLNEQLTQKELETLRESGMPTFEINRITPIIETNTTNTTDYLGASGHRKTPQEELNGAELYRRLYNRQ
jgi:hypothetical protein